MPLYTFYPCKKDGTSTTFETYDLPDDSAAFLRAHKVAEDHRSCSCVTIWCGRRRVGMPQAPPNTPYRSVG